MDEVDESDAETTSHEKKQQQEHKDRHHRRRKDTIEEQHYSAPDVDGNPVGQNADLSHRVGNLNLHVQPADEQHRLGRKHHHQHKHHGQAAGSSSSSSAHRLTPGGIRQEEGEQEEEMAVQQQQRVKRSTSVNNSSGSKDRYRANASTAANSNSSGAGKERATAADAVVVVHTAPGLRPDKPIVEQKQKHREKQQKHHNNRQHRQTYEKTHEYFEAILSRKKEAFNRRFDNPTAAGFIGKQHRGHLSDYLLIRTIGTGSFGRVVLARRRADNQPFAVKILRKAKVVSSRQVGHTLDEKRLLHAVDNHFLVRLHDSFKDNSNLYLVLTFVNGGDLFGLAAKHGKFSEAHAKFYIGQILLAMEYLHANSIVYRDLKPENVLVTLRGYLKMTDFGFAKRLEPGKRATVVMYEKIASGNFRFPPGLSDTYVNIVSNFLQVKVDKRLGCLQHGARDVKMHEWLYGFNWILLNEGNMAAPLEPVLSGPDDSRYFERYDETPVTIAAYPEYAADFADF
ncbi:unnamed protein product [Notodromas monacha]|uniref:cAMP-dependent protein kinase n=1 Tax=Notodromas monacha TaxID=399045 RepID=A0A7R9BFR7_9CRUS|nr:unnamed protein product [Notodromas monacha]CAG0914624.1 unnamed protein product [Notodromas monacha]